MGIAQWNWIGAVCLVVVAATPALAQTKQQTEWCVNKGGAFSLDVQLKGCTALIQANVNPNAKRMAWAFNNRGNAYKIKGDYDRAIADYNEAIRLDPKMAQLYNNRGLANAVLKKDYTRSLPDFTEAIRLGCRRGSGWKMKAA